MWTIGYPKPAPILVIKTKRVFKIYKDLPVIILELLSYMNKKSILNIRILGNYFIAIKGTHLVCVRSSGLLWRSPNYVVSKHIL